MGAGESEFRSWFAQERIAMVVKVRTNNGKLLEFVHGPSYYTFVSGSTTSCNLLKRAVRVRRSLPLRSIHVEEKLKISSRQRLSRFPW